MTAEAIHDTQAPAGRLADLLGEKGGWRDASKRAGVGLVLSGAFGLALGARAGGSSLWAHAAGVAAAPAGVLAFGVPALYIVLALFDAPVSALSMARSAGRAMATLGMVLAGLAPICALYTVSAEEELWGAIVALFALILAGMVGLGQFHGSLRDQVQDAPPSTRSAIFLASTIFGLLATIAAARIWFGMVPVFGGGS